MSHNPDCCPGNNHCDCDRASSSIASDRDFSKSITSVGTSKYTLGSVQVTCELPKQFSLPLPSAANFLRKFSEPPSLKESAARRWLPEEYEKPFGGNFGCMDGILAAPQAESESCFSVSLAPKTPTTGDSDTTAGLRTAVLHADAGAVEVPRAFDQGFDTPPKSPGVHQFLPSASTQPSSSGFSSVPSKVPTPPPTPPQEFPFTAYTPPTSCTFAEGAVSLEPASAIARTSSSSEIVDPTDRVTHNSGSVHAPTSQSDTQPLPSTDEVAGVIPVVHEPLLVSEFTESHCNEEMSLVPPPVSCEQAACSLIEGNAAPFGVLEVVQSATLIEARQQPTVEIVPSTPIPGHSLDWPQGSVGDPTRVVRIEDVTMAEQNRPIDASERPVNRFFARELSPSEIWLFTLNGGGVLE